MTSMEYRTLPKTDERVSILGLGAGSLHNADAADAERAIRLAVDAGVNIMDFIPSKASAYEGMARGLKGIRDKVMLQIHIGACYSAGDYGWTTDVKKAVPEFEERLRLLDTDHADFGFIHCIDEESDFNKVVDGGILDYAIKAKDAGTIRHLAFSTHTVDIARKFLELGIFDLAMFSINPMYDYTDESDYGKGEAADRHELYREFERAGVGVSVMKAFAGGQLLDAKQSPFGQALTRAQCLSYALDRPGVITVLPGVRNSADVEELLAYLDATPEERDYSILGSLSPDARGGSCVYCNHCQPCPEGIPIGLTNKYYDLARQGDVLATDHYRTLDVNAEACVQCGHCDARCPFDVEQSARMQEIAAYFNESSKA